MFCKFLIIVLFRAIASRDDKKNDMYWEGNFIDFVNRLYPLMYSDKFKYSEVDPISISLAEPELFEIRKKLVTNAIMNGRSKKQYLFVYKISYEPVENMTTFQPFSISELVVQKINLVRKMEELYKGELDNLKTGNIKAIAYPPEELSDSKGEKKATKRGFFVS